MTINFAHRGFSGEFPENTMLAFQKAVETGCDGIELDVHLTKDGKIVVIHDDTLERTTNGIGYVKDYTLEELKQLDAAARYKGKFKGVTIPTLEEYFEFIKDYPILSNIELKNTLYYYSNLEEKVIELIYEYHLEEKAMFCSFNIPSMMRCKELEPQLKTGLLYGENLGNCGEFAQKCHADFWHPHFSKMKKEDYDNCAMHGIGVNVWTVNEEDDMKRLIGYRVNGIITNFPNKLQKLLKNK